MDELYDFKIMELLCEFQLLVCRRRRLKWTVYMFDVIITSIYFAMRNCKYSNRNNI